MAFHRESPGGGEGVPGAARLRLRRLLGGGGPGRARLCQRGGVRRLNALNAAVSESELPRLILASF